jgi:hypothetical protein
MPDAEQAATDGPAERIEPHREALGSIGKFGGSSRRSATALPHITQIYAIASYRALSMAHIGSFRQSLFSRVVSNGMAGIAHHRLKNQRAQP